jgi:hypothetical protein
MKWLDEAKEARPASACRLPLPLPARTRRRLHGHLPQAAPGGYLWRNPGRSAGERAGEIELCLEVMREDGQPIPPPDRDLASPIDQLVPVAAANS